MSCERRANQNWGGNSMIQDSLCLSAAPFTRLGLQIPQLARISTVESVDFHGMRALNSCGGISTQQPDFILIRRGHAKARVGQEWPTNTSRGDPPQELR